MILYTLIFSACSKEHATDCLKSLGDQTTEVRTLEHFHRIELKGRIDVVMVQDSVDYAIVAFGKNMVSGVETEVREGVLSIREVNRCDWVRDQQAVPLVEVHYENIQTVYSESSGNTRFANPIRSKNFKLEVIDVSGRIEMNVDCDTLAVGAHTGATDISIKGSAHFVYYYNAGYGPLDGSQCQAQVASVHSASTGDIHVRAADILYYQIFDWGNVLVYGSPKLEKWHDKGSGQLFFAGP